LSQIGATGFALSLGRVLAARFDIEKRCAVETVEAANQGAPFSMATTVTMDVAIYGQIFRGSELASASCT
jgi:hypothetical protein